MANRAGEVGHVPHRSERYINRNAGWFFYTREGVVEGPFDNRNQADRALNDFLQRLSCAMPRMTIPAQL